MKESGDDGILITISTNVSGITTVYDSTVKCGRASVPLSSSMRDWLRILLPDILPHAVPCDG